MVSMTIPDWIETELAKAERQYYSALRFSKEGAPVKVDSRRNARKADAALGIVADVLNTALYLYGSSAATEDEIALATQTAGRLFGEVVSLAESRRTSLSGKGYAKLGEQYQRMVGLGLYSP